MYSPMLVSYYHPSLTINQLINHYLLTIGCLLSMIQPPQTVIYPSLPALGPAILSSKEVGDALALQMRPWAGIATR